MPFLEREGIQFHYEICGDGPPVVFCHGLTGNLEQPKELIQPLEGFRLIVWDARGHGKTNPAGSLAGFTFDTFASDLCRAAGSSRCTRGCCRRHLHGSGGFNSLRHPSSVSCESVDTRAAGVD